jgi:hypothetical protein
MLTEVAATKQRIVEMLTEVAATKQRIVEGFPSDTGRFLLMMFGSLEDMANSPPIQEGFPSVSGRVLLV